MKRKQWILVSIVMFLSGGFLFLNPWGNYWTDSLDISSGRYRRETRVCWITTVDRIEETELSKQFRDLIGEPPAPRWRRVNRFTPISRDVSPHYVHHSSPAAVRLLVSGMDQAKLNRDARNMAIRTFLGLLQADDGPYRAGKFAESLFGINSDGKKLGPDSLPPVPPKEP